MHSLTAKTVAGFLRRLVIVSLCLFLSAGSLDFWEAWLFLLVFFIPELLTKIYLLRNDPDLLKRRLKGGASAESRISQKVIISMMGLCYISLILVSGFDHRFSWSRVLGFLVIAGDVVVLCGLWIQFHVFKANTFAAIIVAIVPEQKVISTGPYAVVRHPMYSGVLLMDFFAPIALGSWWGLLVSLARLVVIILRLLDEEKLLRRELPGYEEYCRKVPYRLVPRIW
jgi:protein-S-isoprenylcysteine O-methyltransferase Ste14